MWDGSCEKTITSLCNAVFVKPLRIPPNGIKQQPARQKMYGLVGIDSLAT